MSYEVYCQVDALAVVCFGETFWDVYTINQESQDLGPRDLNISRVKFGKYENHRCQQALEKKIVLPWATALSLFSLGWSLSFEKIDYTASKNQN